MKRLFQLMAEKQASDLFISCGAPINIKINGVVMPVNQQPMDVDTVRRCLRAHDRGADTEFENELEMNPLSRSTASATSASTSSGSAARLAW